MLAFIRGKIVSLLNNEVILDIGGIGCRIGMPVSSLGKVGSVGREVCLHTSLIIGEEKVLLFGFLEPAERDLFELFYSLSGVGPKTALALVGHLSIAEIKQAVAAKNALPFRKVPGVGKKTAEKLIVDLEGKIEKVAEGLFSGSSNLARDATGALVNLGYSQRRAEAMVQKAIEKISPGEDLSLLITAALQCG